MIVITLGDGVEFYIDSSNNMGIREVFRGAVMKDIQLGRASEARFDTLLHNMNVLRAHTTDD